MKQAFGSLRARWAALTSGKRIALGLLAVAVVVGGAMLYKSSTKTEWAVLYANLDDATASDVMQQLDANGVPYRLEGNGSRIEVPQEQLATTRLKLAGEGVTGQPVPPGFEEIFAGQGLATSDFEQRVNYERALEGELARTLLAMEPVSGANVQLSLPERSLYIGTGADDAAEPSASVLVSVDRPLTSREVDTIANLVSSAVEGLTTESVTIATTDGQLLHAAGTDATGGSTESLEITRQYEVALAARLTDLVRVATGAAASTVEVQADLDFTTTNTEHETIDPTKNTPTAEETVTESYTGTGEGAGTVGIDGGPVDSASGSGDGTYTKDESRRTFVPGDRQVTRSTSTAPSVTRLNLAVVVPVPTPDGATPVPPIDPATLQQIVSSAAGLDTARGDTIAIAVVPATAAAAVGLITSPAVFPAEAVVPEGPNPLYVGIAAGVAAMAVLMLIMRMRRKKRARKVAAELAALGGPDELAAAVGRKRRRSQQAQPVNEPVPAAETPVGPIDPDHAALDEIRSDLARMLNESPESLAALLSTWMAK